jgi:hypothetical protein
MGTNEDFSKFTFKPVEFEKGAKRPFRLRSVLSSPGRMSKVSSAYYTIG